MDASLLNPPSHLSPGEALAIAQRAPQVLRSMPSTTGASPLLSILGTSERPEVWMTYENLLLSCLRTGDLALAHECIGRLVERFGDDNQRVMALEGLVREAEAADDKNLQAVLKSYDEILAKDDTNVVCGRWATRKEADMARERGREKRQRQRVKES